MERQQVTKTDQPNNRREMHPSAKPVLTTSALVHQILHLQRALGNHAVGRFIQTKLEIGLAGDIYEREADRVAEQVMRMPWMPENEAISGQISAVSKGNNHIQAKPCCVKNNPSCREEKAIQTKPLSLRITPLVQRQPKEKEGEEVLQAKKTSAHTSRVTPNIESQINSLKGSGQPLPESARAFFEPRFGYDFSRVRVHTNAKAAESARAVNALAYTVGYDTVFAAGQYAPGTWEGKRLLAHELAHVAQQEDSSSRSSEDKHLFRFVSRERTEIGDLNEAVDTASRVADDTGMVGLMRWGRFTAAMGGKGALEALTSPKSGSTARTPFPRYVYTCRCGLIDLRHFYQLMYIAVLRSEEAAVEEGIEHEEIAEPESAFAPEDITSNALGAEFGSQSSWFQRQSTFVSDLRSFLNRCEPVMWHRSVITPAQRDCIVDYYAVDASGGSHRRRTAGSDLDPCNICSGRSDFPFRTDTGSGARIL